MHRFLKRAPGVSEGHLPKTDTLSSCILYEAAGRHLPSETGHLESDPAVL